MTTKYLLAAIMIYPILATGCSTTPAPATMPSAISTPSAIDGWNPAPGKLLAKFHATGVQIYTLTATDGKFAWKFNAPQATLVDGAGKFVASHYAGPTWESTDGSKVIGAKLRERPSANADSIPELQLSAQSHEGTGIFSSVMLIERLNTTGGMAPPIPDNPREGREARVTYTADYAFYAAP